MTKEADRDFQPQEKIAVKSLHGGCAAASRSNNLCCLQLFVMKQEVSHGGTCHVCIQGRACHVVGLKFHLKAIFVGLKFANMNFSFFGGNNFQQLPFSLCSIM